MISSMTESSDTTAASDSRPRILIFHDEMTDFGKGVVPGKEGVAETVAVEPPVNYGQQQSEHRPRSPRDSSDHPLRPSDLPPTQPGRDVISTSRPLQDPIDSRHTGRLSPQERSRPESEQQQHAIPTPVGKRNDTLHCTDLTDTDIAAGDRPTEDADQKENTETTSDHRGSGVSANNANNSASETDDSSVTDEQRGLVSVYNLR